ncbi:MAG: Hpt domain-containing protein [bacterium]
MTPGALKNGGWQPPVSVQAAARRLFAEVIPNLETLAGDYRVDTDVLDDEIYRLFCAHLRENVGALAAAVAATDEKATRAFAHSLEGMGGTMGFPEISAVGTALSRSARAGEWPICRLLHERLELWLQTAEAAARSGEPPP